MDLLVYQAKTRVHRHTVAGPFGKDIDILHNHLCDATQRSALGQP
jgi:hypothetical protein